MNNFIKTMLTSLIILIVFSIGIGLVKMSMGNYFINASFITSGLVILGVIAMGYLAFIGIKHIWIPLLLLVLTFQSCNYAKSNQQVVISTDCGMTWSKINPGDAVPTGAGNRCFQKVVMPNYPMQGESKFIGNLKERVKVNVHIDYDYSITEALAFIRQAKRLGSSNANADSPDALNDAAFESAENSVIDKRIKDVAKGLFITEDIVELEQSELEDKLLIECNKILEPLGVHLNFITLTFQTDEQTNQAIDVATAMRIYKSKGLEDVGKQVMVAKASATKVVVENKTEIPKEE